MRVTKRVFSFYKVLNEYNAKLLILFSGILYWCYGLMPLMDKVFNIVIIYCVLCFGVIVFRRKSVSITILNSFLIGVIGIATFLLNPENITTVYAAVYMVIASGLMTYCLPEKSATDLKKELNTIANMFFFVGVVIIALSLLLYFLGVAFDYRYENVTTTFLHLGRSITTNALVGILSNANIASDFCVIFMGLTLYLSRAFPRRKAIYFASILLCLVMLYFTYSRGGYIGIIVMVGVELLLDLKCKTKSIGYNIMMIVVLVVSISSFLFLFFSDGFMQIINGFTFTGRKSWEMESSASVRFLMWQTGWEILKSSPLRFLFGVGSTIRDAVAQFAPRAIPKRLYNNMHNVYMQTMVSFGCIGLLLFLNQIVNLLGAILRRINKNIRLFWDLIPIIALEIGLLVINFVESDIYMKKPFEGMTFWILLGFLFSITRARTREMMVEENNSHGN